MKSQAIFLSCAFPYPHCQMFPRGPRRISTIALQRAYFFHRKSAQAQGTREADRNIQDRKMKGEAIFLSSIFLSVYLPAPPAAPAAVGTARRWMALREESAARLSDY
jgi:hypothetical protein